MTAGKYVIDGTHKTFRFYSHHFSRVFTYWILGIASLLAHLLIIPAPFFQTSRYQVCRMIDKCQEAYVSKSFERKEGSYGNLLVFDVLWVLFTLAGVAIIGGLGYLIFYLVIEIDRFSYNDLNPDRIMDPLLHEQFVSNCLFLFIPFGLLALIFLIYALIYLQIGTGIANKNRNLKTSDILLDSFTTMKKIGGKMFAIDLLYFFELLTFAAIVVVPILLVSIFIKPTSSDFVSMPAFIVYVLIAVDSILGIFFFPYFCLACDMSTYLVLSEEADSDVMVLVLPGEEEEKKNLEALSPRDDDKGEEKELKPGKDLNSPFAEDDKKAKKKEGR